MSGSYSGVFANGYSFTPIGMDASGNVWNGSAFVPASTISTNTTNGFSGSFDGGGYTISGLNISAPSGKYAGLFGVSMGAISNLTVSGSVSGSTGVGGVVGLLFKGGSLTNVTSNVTVSGTTLIGGLVGNATANTSITGSRATGHITGTGDVGGLVGYTSGATITRSSSTGAVTGSSYTGGLVGYAYNTSISDSYAVNSVSGGIGTGGLVGKLNGGSVTNSFSVGTVTAPGAGGLIGQSAAGASVTSSYWNTTVSGLSTSAGGTGRTTTQLQDGTNYATLFAGWNFSTIWNTPSSGTYPTLK